MLLEEVEHIEHVFKSVAILEGEEMCDEEQAEIVQSFQYNIAKDLKENFDTYKACYEFESDSFDVNEAELLQDYIADNAVEFGLNRLKSYADLYYLLRIAERHNDPTKNNLSKLKNDILDDLDLYIGSYLISEGDDTYNESVQCFDVDEDSWAIIQDIRGIIEDADRVLIGQSEIAFLLPDRLNEAVARTRIDMEFNTAVKSSIPTEDDLAFRNCRESCQEFFDLIKPYLKQSIKNETAQPKMH